MAIGTDGISTDDGHQSLTNTAKELERTRTYERTNGNGTSDRLTTRSIRARRFLSHKIESRKLHTKHLNVARQKNAGARERNMKQEQRSTAEQLNSLYLCIYTNGKRTKEKDVRYATTKNSEQRTPFYSTIVRRRKATPYSNIFTSDECKSKCIAIYEEG